MHQREALSVNLLPGAELTVPWARQIVDIAAVSLNKLFLNDNINYAGASGVRFPRVPDIGGYKSGRNAYIFEQNGQQLYILSDMFDFDGVQYSYT